MTRFGIFMIWNELRYLNFLELKKLKIGMLLDIESSKNSDLGTVFDINTRTGLANFYGLTKLNNVYGLIFVLHLDSTSKTSAKRVMQHSHQQLTHQRFRETFLSGKTLRIYNYSIKSKAHTNITIAQNRIALSSSIVSGSYYSTG